MARINTNVSALTAQRHLNLSYHSMNETMTHLSTGLRIARGKDDPAGLIVSERLRTEINAVGQAVSNTQRAKLIVSTAEGALEEVASLLKDIQQKIVEAANEGAFSEEEMRANQLQIDSAVDSITRIANTTSFAGRKLLDGSLSYLTSGVALSTNSVRSLQVHATQFGQRDSVPVEVSVMNAASQATLGFPFAALVAGASSVTIELRGTAGATTMTFASNTAASQVAEAIIAVADATGISATVSNGGADGFRMYSRGYGSREFVTIRVLSDTGDFPTTGGTTGKEDYGMDAVVTINGQQAGARGNHVTMKNSTVDLEFDLEPNWVSNASFAVTGGGALFQVGPRVNTNLQVNMAVTSVHASRLGNSELGFLSQIKTGEDYSLEEAEYDRASKIVDAAITQISVLRGRLGSFERNTLDTNMNQLGITQENLISAESAIRDADFAYETSRLARDQILVNAGTTVLTLANQTTQSVLRLLGG